MHAHTLYCCGQMLPCVVTEWISEQFLTPELLDKRASARQMFRSGECNPNSGAKVAHRSLAVRHDVATTVLVFFCLNWVCMHERSHFILNDKYIFIYLLASFWQKVCVLILLRHDSTPAL